MTEPAAEKARRVRCADCRKLRPCGCDSQEWASDKAAAAFAKSAGAKIPGVTDGRPFGGELERTDRRAPQDVIADTLAKVDDRAQMRAQLELVQIRLAQVRKVAAQAPHELALIQVEELALRLHVEGRTFPEISKALGRSSHSHGSNVLKRLREEARQRRGVERGVVAIPCACRRVGCVVVQTQGRGAPRRWRTEKCRIAVRDARRNKRQAYLRKYRRQISGVKSARG